MFARVFRSRLPKTVQCRKFYNPDTNKNESVYKKIQSDPELANYFETLKNDLGVITKYIEKKEKQGKLEQQFTVGLVAFLVSLFIGACLYEEWSVRRKIE